MDRNQDKDFVPPGRKPAEVSPAGVPPVTRRGFLKAAISALGGLAAVELGIIGVRYLAPLRDKEEFQGVVEVGPVEEIQPGSMTMFPEAGFFLGRAEDGGLFAIYRRCPHLGCTVNWLGEENQFICPCHASHFDFYGDFKDSQVSRALDGFEVQVKDGVVLVDTNKLLRREQFSPDQLVYA